MFEAFVEAAVPSCAAPFAPFIRFAVFTLTVFTVFATAGPRSRSGPASTCSTSTVQARLLAEHAFNFIVVCCLIDSEFARKDEIFFNFSLSLLPALDN